MAVCPRCKKEIDESLGFCAQCGEYVGERAAQTPVDLPSDPFERGAVLTSSGDLAGGIEAWLPLGDVDDDRYARMVEAVNQCLLNNVVAPAQYARARLADLAAGLEDRDLLPDILARLVENRGVCTLQAGGLGLCNAYMFVAVDCFSVYTDPSDLLEVCDNAVRDVTLVRDAVSGMPAPEGKNASRPMEIMEHYISFMTMVAGHLRNLADRNDEAAMEALGDHWSSQSVLPYVRHLKNAFAMDLQSAVAGRLLGKLMVKARDGEMQQFITLYASPIYETR